MNTVLHDKKYKTLQATQSVYEGASSQVSVQAPDTYCFICTEVIFGRSETKYEVVTLKCAKFLF